MKDEQLLALVIAILTPDSIKKEYMYSFRIEAEAKSIIRQAQSIIKEGV